MKKSVYLALIAKASAEDPPATEPRVGCRKNWRGLEYTTQGIEVNEYGLQTCYDAAKLVVEADFATQDVCVANWDTDYDYGCVLYYPDSDERYGDSRYDIYQHYNEEYDYELPDQFDDQAEFDTQVDGIHAWVWLEGTQVLTPIDEYTGPEPDVMQPGTSCTMPETPGDDDLVVLQPAAFKTPEACYGEALWYFDNLADGADLCVYSYTVEDAYKCVGVKIADQGDIREDTGAATLDEMGTPETIVDDITYEEFQEFKSSIEKSYAWVWVDGALVETALESSWDYDGIEAQFLDDDDDDVDDDNDVDDDDDVDVDDDDKDKDEDAATWMPAGVATIAAAMTFMF